MLIERFGKFSGTMELKNKKNISEAFRNIKWVFIFIAIIMSSIRFNGIDIDLRIIISTLSAYFFFEVVAAAIIKNIETIGVFQIYHKKNNPISYWFFLTLYTFIGIVMMGGVWLSNDI